jgi:lipopolysaccharide transport protein LptA
MKIARIAVRLAGLVLVLSIISIGGQVYAATTLRIAVAPFAGEQGTGEESALSVANALAARLSHSSIERLIAPGDFVARSVFEPRASEVRRWAYNSAVDTIVVGRVFKQNGTGQDAPRVVETVIRSGHSGAELSRHDVVVPNAGDLDRSVEELAAAILEGLGHVEPAADDLELETSAPAVSANAAADRPPEGELGSSERGLDVALSESGFRGDAPIEIKADEAEIINHNGGRKLIFRRNVWVRQGNVTLRSDRLEASYRKGESEPRELVAEGNVQIVQNDRRAKCDRAIYLRDASRLTCSGRAELVQGCDIIRGESIEFDLAGDQARVEGAASIVIQPKEKVPSACTKIRGKM